MNNHIANRQRRREFLITLSFTIFSVLMIVVTTIERWPIWYVPLIALEVAFVWWEYTIKFQSYLFRAFTVTAMTCLNVFLYGIQGENFNVLIPTLCVEIVLLSLYELPRIMDIAIVQTVFLFLYHAAIKQTFIIPEESLERNRMMLQILSLVILIILCIYRIYHHVQEETDVVNLENQVRMEKKVKDDFMANTSHELRTPVNTISGMCEILLQKNLPDDIHGGVLDIQMTGVELQNIVTDIMDYAALESGTMGLSPRAYNITSTLNDVMNMTVFENRDKHLEIIFDCDPNIPCLLEGDEHQLRRILNNLISNAIKFTSEGGLLVRVTYRKEDYGINLIVSVKDTGVGLSLEECERILQDFYQTDSDRNRRSSGVGLGLTISSALIKKMGGFLTIKSQPGKGSEFSFAIPQKVLNDQPCISLKRPGAIKLVWFYNPQSEVTTMRDAFVDHIKHFSDYFGIVSQRATSLEECKRRISRGQSKHLIIGQAEYEQDKKYFDDLSETITIILVADRSQPPKTGPRIHVLYKPYNAMMLAEIFNGSDATQSSQKKKQRRFVAPKAKILVVDDNLMNLKVVEGLLRKYRIKIVAATSGEEALTLIESRDYDFVFMDHMMPGMDGVECFHHIRDKQGPYFKQVPIIALTANAIAGSREMFMAEGFNEFIAKPIDTALLNEVLHRFIPIEKQFDEEDLAPETGSRETPAKAETTEQSKKSASKKSAKTAKKKTKAESKKPDEDTKEAEKKEAEKTAQPKAEEKKADDAFAMLPDIDKDTAIMYCGSAEDFLELAEVYCVSGKTYAENLQESFDKKDMKNYALISHTIKSTSKTLGAVKLSELALTQEMAAKEGKEDVISSNHEEFIASYKNILGQIEACLGAEEDTKAEESDPENRKGSGDEIENWDELRNKMKTALESFETKAFEDCLDAVRGQKLEGKPIENVLADVLQKANNFDFDGAIAMLEEIGGKA